MPRRPGLLAVALVGALACTRPEPPAPDDREARALARLTRAVQLAGTPPAVAPIGERMARFHVPGVSIAVADGGRIAWARGLGVTTAGGRDPVTPTTLFPAASISKAVTATAALRLVDQGRLALDEDVNRRLRAWKVPDSELTRTEKVTLRRLLSHSAGTNVHMFPCFKAHERLPTLVEELDGLPPAKTAPVRVEAVPGSGWRYSGGAMLIEQLLLTEVTGTPFPPLLEDLVLAPLGMRDSTFAQPLPPALRARLAAEHDLRGAVIPDWYDVCPELAASGLTSTPSDLLRWAIGVADARAGRAGAILAPATAAAMLTVQAGPSGLGPFLEGEGDALRFFHEGADGGFHAIVVYYPARGQGAAVMVNGEGGYPLIKEILFALAETYRWPGLAPRTVRARPARPDERAAVVGRFQAPYEGALTDAAVRLDGARLVLDIPLLGVTSELAFTGATTLTMLDVGEDLALVTDAGGAVTGLRIGSVTLRRVAP